jgi:hypothetical protein
LVNINSAHDILIGRPEEDRPLGRPTVNERTILKYILKTKFAGVDWIEFAQDRIHYQALKKLWLL